MKWFGFFVGWKHIRCPFCHFRFIDDIFVPDDLKKGHVFPPDKEYVDWLCQHCGGKVRISIKSKRCLYTHQMVPPKWYKPDCEGQQYFWDDLFE